MDVAIFDFTLPERLIALRPASPLRDSARLLVVRAGAGLEHRSVRDLPGLLAKGDILVANDSKVISARLLGRRLARPGFVGNGPQIEILLHKRAAANRFFAFARPARKLKPGDTLVLGRTLDAQIVWKGQGGEVALQFVLSGTELDGAIADQGETPLPPYIAANRKVDARDALDYQTAFAAKAGSVAAPTAGLHFTAELLDRLEQAGVTREMVTLHVGAGTFQPVTVRDTQEHKMHGEWVSLDAAAAQRLNSARQAGGRIIAVGTTSLRTLESAAQEDGVLTGFAGDTEIFITPGYCFKTAEILLTNFHLPRSTLFMLTCAFMGTDVMRAAYQEAIRENYRFYSYGDACLLFRPR